MIQHNLAGAYHSRIFGKRVDNLEQALSHCNQALEVYTRQDFPEDWAMVQGTLANVFLSRIAGERSANLEQAISCNKQALQVYACEDFPVNWAAIHLNL
jgi:hypothetical protein